MTERSHAGGADRRGSPQARHPITPKRRFGIAMAAIRGEWRRVGRAAGRFPGAAGAEG